MFVVTTSINPLLVVLGAPNDAEGVLLPVALSRVATVVDVHRTYPRSFILPTGGIGKHFNATDLPHYTYVTEELASRGINRGLILPGVPSQNTAEDAKGACRRAKTLGIKHIVLITSDFHCERASFLFSRHGPSMTIETLSAPSDRIDPAELKRLQSHERSALEKLSIS